MTAEERYLVACARRAVGSPADVPATQQGKLDRELIYALASRHAVLPLVPHVPRPMLESYARHSLALSAELVRLLALFEAQEIPVVSLKGPALETLLYGDSALRFFSDLDLLVHPQDRGRAFGLLTERGYVLVTTLPWANDLRNKEDELTLRNPSTGICVDLHWSLLPGYFPQPIPPERIWGELRTLPIAGHAVGVFGDEDLLLFLCGHGAKHLWERLGWLCDVARLIHVRPALDWQGVLQKAKEQGYTRILLVGLAVVHELLGTTLPAQLLGLIEKDKLVRSRVAMLHARLFANALSPAPGPEQIRFTWPLLVGGYDKSRYFWGMAVAPTEAEFMAAQMPPGMFWGYYPVRVGRLLWQGVLRKRPI